MFEFGTNEDWRWDGSREAVQFTVRVNARQVVCCISKECIADNFGDPSTDAECLDAARVRFDQITDLAGRLITAGRFEADGAILIRSSDWRTG